MTVVSSFTGEEMDPERLRSEGAKMLRDYLLYAASSGPIWAFAQSTSRC